MTLPRTLPRVLGVAALAVIPLVLASVPAAAATTVNLDCRASTPVGNQNTTLSQGITVTAPATVKPGAGLTVVIDPEPSTLPTKVNGYTLKEIKNFSITVPIPANSSYVSSSLSGGSGLNSTPKLTVSGNKAVLTFAGPVKGGATFELPTVTAQLKAGNSGTIATKLGGTSYDDPGVTLTAVINAGFDVNAPTACYPNPSPTFTTTTIG